MSRVKQIGMAAATFGVALGVGFVMQNGDAIAGRFGNDGAPAGVPDQTPIAEAASVAGPTEVAEAAPRATPAEEGQPQVAMTEPFEAPSEEIIAETIAAIEEAPAPEMDAPVAAIETASLITIPEAISAPETTEAPVVMAEAEVETAPSVLTDAAPVLAEDCLVGMESAIKPGALVEVSISAPCHAGSPFTVHHQGMMFTAATDETGNAVFTVPALAQVAVIIAAFPDGEGNVTTVTVPELAGYDRAVLQWSGNADVMLSAYEFGAGYGEAGHVSRMNQQVEARAVEGEGGFLMSLGTDAIEEALFAEVYTFPTGMVSRGGDVRLVAEAEITAENCGQELSAQSLQVGLDGATDALDLYLIMPDCDAVGDFLILQNMFEDLTLAAR